MPAPKFNARRQTLKWGNENLRSGRLSQSLSSTSFIDAIVIIQTLVKEIQIEQNRFIELCSSGEGKRDSYKFGSSYIKLWLNQAIRLIKMIIWQISSGTLCSRILRWLNV